MIKVLVIDDSLFMRRLVSDLLSSDPEITVIDTAKSGDEALKKIPKLKPDVMTLDLAMPGTGGLETLKKIMATSPIPTVILSAYSHQAADMTLECLHAGAVGFVAKPSGELSLDIYKVRQQLISEVKSAAGVDRKRLVGFLKERKGVPPTPSLSPRGRGRLVREKSIVVIGASTGGPQTLELILSSLPPHFSLPLVVVQHMPDKVFTHSLAKRLDEGCSLPVREAEEGKKIERGHVYLVPPGFNVELNSKIHLTKEPPSEGENLTPSIDVAMKSVAFHYKKKAIGVILTGMGSDGVGGMRSIRQAGGRTLVEDQSALIFGMPQKVIEEGLADFILPAEKIGEKLVEMIIDQERILRQKGGY